MTEESASTDSSRNSWITWIIIATASAWVVGLACGVLLTRPGKEKAKVAVVGAEADVDKGRFRKSQSKTRPADPRIKEYQLNLSVRKTESREIKISIDTDFPNGTNLHVWVRRTYYEKGNPEKYSGEIFSKDVAVREGKVDLLVTVDDSLWVDDYHERARKSGGVIDFTGIDYASPKIQVIVLVSPMREQREDILRVLGTAGEFIAGPGVRRLGSRTYGKFTTYEVSQELDFPFLRNRL